MSHHPERTARNVRPVNQPPSIKYIIFLSAQHKGKRQKVPRQGNIFAISAIAKSDCPVVLRNITPSLVVYFQFSPIVKTEINNEPKNGSLNFV